MHRNFALRHHLESAEKHGTIKTREAAKDKASAERYRPVVVKTAILANFLDANRIDYEMGMPGKEMEPADQARAMSGSWCGGAN